MELREHSSYNFSPVEKRSCFSYKLDATHFLDCLPLSVTIPASCFASPDLSTTRAPTFWAFIYILKHDT